MLAEERPSMPSRRSLLGGCAFALPAIAALPAQAFALVRPKTAAWRAAVAQYETVLAEMPALHEAESSAMAMTCFPDRTRAGSPFDVERLNKACTAYGDGISRYYGAVGKLFDTPSPDVRAIAYKIEVAGQQGTRAWSDTSTGRKGRQIAIAELLALAGRA